MHNEVWGCAEILSYFFPFNSFGSHNENSNKEKI